MKGHRTPAKATKNAETVSPLKRSPRFVTPQKDTNQKRKQRTPVHNEGVGDLRENTPKWGICTRLRQSPSTCTETQTKTVEIDAKRSSRDLRENFQDNFRCNRLAGCDDKNLIASPKDYVCHAQAVKCKEQLQCITVTTKDSSAQSAKVVGTDSVLTPEKPTNQCVSVGIASPRRSARKSTLHKDARTAISQSVTKAQAHIHSQKEDKIQINEKGDKESTGVQLDLRQTRRRSKSIIFENVASSSGPVEDHSPQSIILGIGGTNVTPRESDTTITERISTMKCQQILSSDADKIGGQRKHTRDQEKPRQMIVSCQVKVLPNSHNDDELVNYEEIRRPTEHLAKEDNRNLEKGTINASNASKCIDKAVANSALSESKVTYNTTRKTPLRAVTYKNSYGSHGKQEDMHDFNQTKTEPFTTTPETFGTGHKNTQRTSESDGKNQSQRTSARLATKHNASRLQQQSNESSVTVTTSSAKRKISFSLTSDKDSPKSQNVEKEREGILELDKIHLSVASTTTDEKIRGRNCEFGNSDKKASHKEKSGTCSGYKLKRKREAIEGDEDVLFLPRRKKLRSEVTQEELWEGFPLNATFKRFTSKPKLTVDDDNKDDTSEMCNTKKSLSGTQSKTEVKPTTEEDHGSCSIKSGLNKSYNAKDSCSSSCSSSKESSTGNKRNLVKQKQHATLLWNRCTSSTNSENARCNDGVMTFTDVEEKGRQNKRIDKNSDPLSFANTITTLKSPKTGPKDIQEKNNNYEKANTSHSIPSVSLLKGQKTTSDAKPLSFQYETITKHIEFTQMDPADKHVNINLKIEDTATFQGTETEELDEETLLARSRGSKATSTEIDSSMEERLLSEDQTIVKKASVNRRLRQKSMSSKENSFSSNTSTKLESQLFCKKQMSDSDGADIESAKGLDYSSHKQPTSGSDVILNVRKKPQRLIYTESSSAKKASPEESEGSDLSTNSETEYTTIEIFVSSDELPYPFPNTSSDEHSSVLETDRLETGDTFCKTKPTLLKVSSKLTSATDSTLTSSTAPSSSDESSKITKQLKKDEQSAVINEPDTLSVSEHFTLKLGETSQTDMKKSGLLHHSKFQTPRKKRKRSISPSFTPKRSTRLLAKEASKTQSPTIEVTADNTHSKSYSTASCQSGSSSTSSTSDSKSGDIPMSSSTEGYENSTPMPSGSVDSSVHLPGSLAESSRIASSSSTTEDVCSAETDLTESYEGSSSLTSIGTVSSSAFTQPETDSDESIRTPSIEKSFSFALSSSSKSKRDSFGELSQWKSLSTTPALHEDDMVSCGFDSTNLEVQIKSSLFSSKQEACKQPSTQTYESESNISNTLGKQSSVTGSISSSSKQSSVTGSISSSLYANVDSESNVNNTDQLKSLSETKGEFSTSSQSKEKEVMDDVSASCNAGVVDKIISSLDETGSDSKIRLSLKSPNCEGIEAFKKDIPTKVLATDGVFIPKNTPSHLSTVSTASKCLSTSDGNDQIQAKFSTPEESPTDSELFFKLNSTTLNESVKEAFSEANHSHENNVQVSESYNGCCKNDDINCSHRNSKSDDSLKTGVGSCETFSQIKEALTVESSAVIIPEDKPRSNHIGNENDLKLDSVRNEDTVGTNPKHESVKLNTTGVYAGWKVPETSFGSAATSITAESPSKAKRRASRIASCVANWSSMKSAKVVLSPLKLSQGTNSSSDEPKNKEEGGDIEVSENYNKETGKTKNVMTACQQEGESKSDRLQRSEGQGKASHVPKDNEPGSSGQYKKQRTSKLLPLRIKLKKNKCSHKSKSSKKSKQRVEYVVDQIQGVKVKCNMFVDKLKSKKKKKSLSSIIQTSVGGEGRFGSDDIGEDSNDVSHNYRKKPKKKPKKAKKPKQKKKSKTSSESPSVETDIRDKLRPNARRLSDVEDLLANQVLNKHACTLWSSERRRHFQLTKPDASHNEIDDILRTTWSNLPDKEKLRYFQRARNALRDENRHSYRKTYSQEPVTTEHLESAAMRKFLSLSTVNQLTELRKRMHFCHEVSPELYRDIMTEFKRDLKEEKSKPRENVSKRADEYTNTGSQALHRKLLYQKLMESQEALMEIYKEKRARQTDTVNARYKATLRRLISGEEIQLGTESKSEKLTEVLHDITDLERQLKIGVSGEPKSSKSFEQILDGLKEDDGQTGPLKDTEDICELGIVLFDDENLEHILSKMNPSDFPVVDAFSLDDVLNDKQHLTGSDSSSSVTEVHGSSVMKKNMQSSPSSMLTDWIIDDQIKLSAQQIDGHSQEGSQYVSVFADQPQVMKFLSTYGPCHVVPMLPGREVPQHSNCGPNLSMNANNHAHNRCLTKKENNMNSKLALECKPVPCNPGPVNSKHAVTNPTSQTVQGSSYPMIPMHFGYPVASPKRSVFLNYSYPQRNCPTYAVETRRPMGLTVANVTWTTAAPIQSVGKSQGGLTRTCLPLNAKDVELRKYHTVNTETGLRQSCPKTSDVARKVDASATGETIFDGGLKRSC